VTPSLDRRVREYRARVLVRSWNCRQRNHAGGVWHELRRVLANAERAFVVSMDEIATLVAEGYPVEPVGQKLEPPKAIVLAPADRVARIASARVVPVQLGPELLAAAGLVLTPFDHVSLRRRYPPRPG
jgi:hypothetical protein